MCGIIAVLRRRSDRPVPASSDLLARIDGAVERVAAAPVSDLAAELSDLADRFGEVDRLLRGTVGVRALLADRNLSGALDDRTRAITEALAIRESELDDLALEPAELEATNAAVIRLKDAVWAIARDRLRTATAVADLAGRTPSPEAIEAFTAVQAALSAIDRLEVRGRDSAGINVLVRGHGLDPSDPEVAGLLADRLGDPLFTDGAVRFTPEGHLSIVYKRAAEIGELGDNVAAIRASIREDVLLRRALASVGAEVTVLGHTRWASIGIIS